MEEAPFGLYKIILSLVFVVDLITSEEDTEVEAVGVLLYLTSEVNYLELIFPTPLIENR